ncbi:hypothetical protein ACL00T_04205 [Curtobacterium flaccumfaciens]
MPDRAASTPSDALRLLVDGNARFAADKRRMGRVDPDRRTEARRIAVAVRDRPRLLGLAGAVRARLRRRHR